MCGRGVAVAVSDPPAGRYSAQPAMGQPGRAHVTICSNLIMYKLVQYIVGVLAQ